MSIVRVTRRVRDFYVPEGNLADVGITIDGRVLTMNWREFRVLAEAVQEFNEKTQSGSGMNLEVTRRA